MTRLIKDRLNIEVDALWESDEYANKLALEFAAGTLPDMFYMPESAYLLYRQTADNGLLYDLGSIYDECAGDYLKYVNETYDNRTLIAFTEADGSMYALASGNFDYNGHPQLWAPQGLAGCSESGHPHQPGRAGERADRLPR